METLQQRYIAVRKVTLIGALANLVQAILKTIFGYLGQSAALMADGVHSFSDLLTDALVLVAAKYGSHAADAEHPYGHARIETFASLLLSLFLIIVGLAIGWHGVQQLIYHQHISSPDSYVIWFAGFSVALNEIVYRYTLIVGKKIKSDLLIANALHSRSDAAASLVVLIGVAGSLLGYFYLDQVAAIIVALMIMKMGVRIGWDNIAELIDTGLDAEQLQKIRQIITNEPGVQALHELRTRRMAGRALLDVHIIVDPYITVSEGHHIAEHVMWNLKKQVTMLEDVVVHIDSENDENYSSTSKLPMRHELLPELLAAWKNLPGINQLVDLHIHYLAGSIQLEPVLPMSVLQHGTAEALQQQYASACRHLTKVGKVTLLFHV